MEPDVDALDAFRGYIEEIGQHGCKAAGDPAPLADRHPPVRELHRQVYRATFGWSPSADEEFAFGVRGEVYRGALAQLLACGWSAWVVEEVVYSFGQAGRRRGATLGIKLGAGNLEVRHVVFPPFAACWSGRYA